MDDVRSPDVTRFLLRKLQTVGVSRAKLMVGALRSFFRFLRWRGDIAIDLASSVPKVADWRVSALPKDTPAGGGRALGPPGSASPRKGAHLLRHSLATEMLRKGASLAEIGEILRHRSVDTTSIYAKVDLVALRALA